jgi:hypothetical protein
MTAFIKEERMMKKTFFAALVCLLAAGGAFGQAGSIRLSGWRVNYAGIQEKNGDFILKKPTVQLYSTMNSGVLEFPSLVLDSSRNLKSCGVGTKPVDFLSTNGFGVLAKSYQFTENGLFIAGDVSLPARDGKGAYRSIVVAFAKRELPLDSDGRITFRIPAPADFVYESYGFKIKAEEISLPSWGPFALVKAKLMLGDPAQAVDFGTLKFSIDPEVDGETHGSCDAAIELDGRKFSIADCQLGKGTLTGSAWFDEGGENAVYREFTVTADGKVSFGR